MAQETERSPEGPAAAALDAVQANALSQLAALATGVQAFEAHRMKVLAALGRLGVERARVVGGDVDMHVRAVAAEVGALSRVSDQTVAAQISEAMDLVESWPVALEAFATGRIGRGHLRAIVDAGGVLATTDVTPEDRAAFESSMVALAETTTPARVGKVARREAEQHVPEPAIVRHHRAREARHVRITPGDDGMSFLGAWIPAVLAQGIDHRLRAGARGKTKDDPRTIAQWRADAFCELLLTGAGAPTVEATAAGSVVERPGAFAAIVPVVQITIPVTTITGADDRHATLDGLQPVDADTARVLVGAASAWERLLTDPITGTLLEVDTYRPTAAQLRHLRARDQHCRFPGCGVKARRRRRPHDRVGGRRHHVPRQHRSPLPPAPYPQARHRVVRAAATSRRAAVALTPRAHVRRYATPCRTDVRRAPTRIVLTLPSWHCHGSRDACRLRRRAPRPAVWSASGADAIR